MLKNMVPSRNLLNWSEKRELATKAYQKKDEIFMKKALALAKKGLGKTSPNPPVGAVLVQNNKIITTGWHKKAGGLHAEIKAIQSAQKRGLETLGSTLYLSLSPCCHFGKTGPCTKAIIEAGIKKVVSGVLDPNPLSKETPKILEKHGIKFLSDVLKKESKEIIRGHEKFIKKKLPFVTLKIAMSLNGKISGQKKRYLTNELSRKYVHKLRSQKDAIITGIGTILKDDPHLGVRLVSGHEPLRVILDSSLKIPLNAKVLRDRNVLIVTTNSSPKEKQKLIRGKTNMIVYKDEIKIKRLLKNLGQRGIREVLVEGGMKINTTFFSEKMFDEALFFVAPITIKKGKNFVSKNVKNFDISFHKMKTFDRDLLFFGKLKKRIQSLPISKKNP
ncbi:bifunctional diaminohydroxyphosphoribosylaminopyrimidine deaminase/5-amino-6-(5-phosphoribosylamino)uracil reductase RibD [Candidatus Peregrinibacteria bacterium]|nr:bifunctional diaminohydroxyphosphoribosylaminopyrimidine deaminase/5-amino-6-(5-phosphoribosylamino)uracil reductase RibD [Candidatus Peregrinibacteria bacterium]